MAARSRSNTLGGNRGRPATPSADELDRMLIKEKVGHLLSVRDLAIGAGMLTVFLIAFGQTKFRPAVEELLKGNVSWSFVLYLSTVASLILLGIFWYAHGTDELEILENWLRPSQFKFHTKKRQYLIIFAVGITLPLMAVYSDFIAIFAICFTGYLLVDLWAWKVRREEIGRAVRPEFAVARQISADQRRPSD